MVESNLFLDNVYMGNGLNVTQNTMPVKKEDIVKKALLVGINYTGTDNKLNGCINDTENLHNFLLKNKYFEQNELTMMNDFKQGDLYPSKENMEKQLNELVAFANSDANKGKKVYLFFSYSGHGYHLDDENGDEEDGQDEVLCPIDCIDNGFIVDDDIRNNFVNKLPENVTLVVLIDACHSFSMLDLKYNYACDTKNTYKTHGKIADTKCNLIMISGCLDTQTSADAFIPDVTTKKNEYQGAMTAAFLNNYKDEITTKKLVKAMRDWLKAGKYTQIPQLTSGKFIDVSQPFLLSIFNN